jgi:hypothetical protein
MTIYSRATDRMASNLLQPTFSLAAALQILQPSRTSSAFL